MSVIRVGDMTAHFQKEPQCLRDIWEGAEGERASEQQVQKCYDRTLKTYFAVCKGHRPASLSELFASIS